MSFSYRYVSLDAFELIADAVCLHNQSGGRESVLLESPITRPVGHHDSSVTDITRIA